MKRFQRIFLFMGLMLADFMALAVFLSLNPGIAAFLSLNSFLLLSITEIIFIFPALPLYLLITRQKLRDVLPLKPLGWKNVAYLTFMSFLLEPATSLLSALTSLFYDNAAMEITSMFTIENLPAALLALAVLPSLVEEICFRGAVLNASKGMSVMNAVIINGLLFGLIHMNPQQIPYAFFLGVIFSLYVIHTQSIYSSILAHFLVNAPNVLIALLLPDNVEPALSVEEALPSLGLLAVIAVLFFIGFLSVYRRFRLYNLYRNPIEKITG